MLNLVHPVTVSLHQHVFFLFSPSNLDKTGFQRIVFELAFQEDSQTPPESLIWLGIECVIDAPKLCSLIFSSTRRRQFFLAITPLNLRQFWIPDSKTDLDQLDKDLAEKTCCAGAK